MIEIFAQAEVSVSRSEVSDWLKKDEDPDQQPCADETLASFLNGMINEMRGKKEGPQPQPESWLSNNIILKKLKIALNLQAEDMIRIFALADFPVSKPELSAFFRKKGHKHYKKCQDQMLRNFPHGIQIEYRDQES
jgi:uncharacterized protein YehS (DUF1456 family)